MDRLAGLISVTRLGKILPFGYFLPEHFYRYEQFKTWFAVLILTLISSWIQMFWTFNLIFGIWAKILATFPKIGQFSFKSSGHSDLKLIFLQDEVDEDLMCQICLQPFVSPLDTPCGHTFCSVSLSQFPDSGSVFTTLHFLRNLRNRPNRLECYITLGWKILPITNTLTHWSNS